MPFDWTAEKERLMLLMAIQEANVKPTKQLWSTVAAKLGGGLSPSAVSQKFWKLRNQSAKLAAHGESASSTLMKPRPGSNKILKSPISARKPKWKRAPEVTTAEISEPEDELAPSAKPTMKAIDNVPFYKAHQEETDVGREDAKAKGKNDAPREFAISAEGFGH